MCKSYPWQDLPEETQKKVLEKEKQLTLEDSDTSDRITEMFENRLEALGLPTKDIRWSLGYSQGDGMAFYGKIDLEDYIKKNNLDFPLHLKAAADGDLTMEIEGSNHHYNHWNSMTLNWDVSGEFQKSIDWQRNQADPLIAHIQKHIKEISKELEGEGYKELEYQTSDEQLLPWLKESGRRWHKNGSLCTEESE